MLSGNDLCSYSMPSLTEQIKESFANAGIQPESKILLACSGGKDSMVLFHLLKELNLNFAVAHMNFQLRGEESEQDEAFVSEASKSSSIPFYSKKVDTHAEKQGNGESTQMAARRLRYDWLSELASVHGFVRVLTAHHARDQAETILLNLMRGTGPKGLQGMEPDNGKILRPLLRVEYDQIEQFVKKNKVEFREDKSNAETKYRRNFLRHKILTPWEDHFPGTVHQLTRTSEIMLESNRFLNQQLEKESSKFVKNENDSQELNIAYSLAEHPDARLLMRYLLEPYGLKDQTPFILQERSRPGAIFSSEKYILVADRTHWSISKKREELKPIYLAAGMEVRWGDYQFLLKERKPGDSLALNNSSILLSKEHLKEPLLVRVWEEGDKMQPFGMKGSKKLSDILIDAKVKRTKKDRIPVVCDADGEILWLTGIKSSERLRLENPDNAPYILEVLDFG